MSKSSGDDKLVATAVAAAAAGAALALAAMKLTSKKGGGDGSMSKNRASFIFEDPERTLSASGVREGDSAVLFPHNHEERMRRRLAARVAVEEDNLTPRTSVTVKVPATSANVGPGCECCCSMDGHVDRAARASVVSYCTCTCALFSFLGTTSHAAFDVKFVMYVASFL
mmetsp:Transcript_51295/g.154146  ORF Transcript_51295/g.154146 Transcript_51295/m.154146 type:complete len:169 (-) Transcript_51295:1256-1762(-)